MNITITSPTGEFEASITISIELLCDPSDPSCSDGADDTKTPPTLELTVPVCDTQVVGDIFGDEDTDVWYVEYRYYRLTEITMYKNEHNTSGFRVTYEVPDDFSGWATETHLFGYDDETSE